MSAFGYEGFGFGSTNSVVATSSGEYLIRIPNGGYKEGELITSETVDAKLKVSKTEKQISPSLYIKYVKSKFTETQRKRLDARLSKLKKMIPYAKEMGQFALYEELAKELALILKEIELEALGVTRSCTRADVDKFMNIVKDKVILFENLEDFPRVIPKKIQAQVKKVKPAFTGLKVLYVDYTDTKKQLKTTSQKIQEKDPILFGYTSLNPDKLYYVADWVDEYCDLSLDKFISQLRLTDGEFSLDEIKELKEEDFKQIVDDIVAKDKALKETNSSNWREKVRIEEREKLLAQVTVPAKKPWWKFW